MFWFPQFQMHLLSIQKLWLQLVGDCYAGHCWLVPKERSLNSDLRSEWRSPRTEVEYVFNQTCINFGSISRNCHNPTGDMGKIIPRLWTAFDAAWHGKTCQRGITWGLAGIYLSYQIKAMEKVTTNGKMIRRKTKNIQSHRFAEGREPMAFFFPLLRVLLGVNVISNSVL